MNETKTTKKYGLGIVYLTFLLGGLWGFGLALMFGPALALIDQHGQHGRAYHLTTLGKLAVIVVPFFWDMSVKALQKKGEPKSP